MDNTPEKENKARKAKAKKTNQHAWNETLKFSWGHIVALLALIIMSYLMYMGAFYNNGGRFEDAAIKVALLDVALLTTFIGAQIMKGVDSHFQRWVVVERVLICLCPVSWLLAMVPYNHFWNVYGERHELVEQFDRSISNARLMFAEYDDYCAIRMARYASTLDSLMADNAPDSLAQAVSTRKDNYRLALKLQVQSANTDSLERLALRWIDDSDHGASVWNAFLLGNIDQITAAIHEWHATLQSYSAPRMSNEGAGASFEASGQAYSEAIAGLTALTDIYTKSKGLNLNAVWTGLLLLLMLMLPYQLQQRNTKANLYYRLNPYYKPKALASTGGDDGEGEAREAWMHVNKADLSALKVYVMLYPETPQAQEANTLINSMLEGTDTEAASVLVAKIHQLQAMNLTPMMRRNQTLQLITEAMDTGGLTMGTFINIIRADHNLLNAAVVKALVDQGVITTADLESAGIERAFIQKMMMEEGLATFPTPRRLERIHKQSTEVYFWGIPSSGKSCALGAILSVAYGGKVAKSMMPDVDSQGYGYMTKLIDLFQNGEIGHLMTGTDIDAFYEMGFDLVDMQDAIHPITCIDMAGELMRCMYKANAGEAMSELDEEMLGTMTNVLVDNRSASRKMHIFVIEYGAEDRRYEGLPQRVYLDGALAYIQATGLLRRDTDAVYIMISKADKLPNPTPEAIDAYIQQQYQGFYRGLEHICRENEINDGRVEQIAFSLGDVCFQNYCRFDARPAMRMVELLLERSASYHGGVRGRIESAFRG